MSKLATYTPEDCTFLIGGILAVEGYVDGSFITVTKDIMPFSTVKTPDGTVARLYNSDQTYTISLSLYSGSDSNDVLTKFWQLDEITQRGKFPLLIKDRSGSDLFFSSTTWIESVPPIVKSTTFDTRTWVLRSSQGVINIGGNGEASSILTDLVNIATSALPILDGII